MNVNAKCAKATKQVVLTDDISRYMAYREKLIKHNVKLGCFVIMPNLITKTRHISNIAYTLWEICFVLMVYYLQGYLSDISLNIVPCVCENSIKSNLVAWNILLLFFKLYLFFDLLRPISEIGHNGYLMSHNVIIFQWFFGSVSYRHFDKRTIESSQKVVWNLTSFPLKIFGSYVILSYLWLYITWTCAGLIHFSPPSLCYQKFNLIRKP